MQNSLATQGQSVNAQINHLMQSVTTQLGQVREQLESWDDAADVVSVVLPTGLPWPVIEATLRAAAPGA